MAQQVLSISQINEYIRSMMDGDRLLCGVAVRGEISNYKVYPSGHHYFTLKDESAALRCVMFKGNALRLRFRPENGMKVIAMGRITVYPRDGAYQLYCTAMSMDGIGDLYAAFEQLKARLSAQGLFDPAHKKPLPTYPGTIGIVTSSAGAAVHDMLRILRKRYPLTRVRLLPVRVQGAEAPGEIAAAIRYANRYRLADLLIVGRGGGSIEDLWAFNDERVARAIYASEIPVISAIGHEPDVTISDFVADRRASTPSNAAEIAVPDQVELRKQLDSAGRAIAQGTLNTLEKADRQLKALAAKRVLTDPMAFIEDRRMQLDSVQQRLGLTAHRQLGARQQQFTALAASLDALSPLKVLGRGYAMVQAADGTVLRTSRQAAAGDKIHVQLEQGALDCTVERTIDGKEE